LIILSPLSLNHTFGRSWVSKSDLSSIVERPQRLLAASIGIAAALSLFPQNFKVYLSNFKSSLYSHHVVKIHGKKWPQEIEKLCQESEKKLAKNQMEVPEGWPNGDIYLNKNTILALKGVVGTLEKSVDSIFDEKTRFFNSFKKVFVVIRPPGHHSHPCTPSGFCLINNAQIAIQYASDTYNITHAVILDIDLHHGDGTQDICWKRAGFNSENLVSDFDSAFDLNINKNEFSNNKYDSSTKKKSLDPKVGYFSLHDINSFPTELGHATASRIKNASTCLIGHGLCIWNVHLQKYKDDNEFYQQYKTRYNQILSKAEEFLTQEKLEYKNKLDDYYIQLDRYNKTKSQSFQTQNYIFDENQKNSLDHNENYNKNYNKGFQLKKPLKPAEFKPMIVISSGFDASEYESQNMRRHDVHVPTSFYCNFTKDVVKLSEKFTKGRVLSLLEGGYSDAALCSGIFSHLIGLADCNWKENWGKEETIKELTKGCRTKWKQIKYPRNELQRWATQVIKLGRLLLPDSII
ncbi:histone deacetylase, partial [Ascoidea rubescens DSM 1968]